jgi:hypothetical protein
MEEEVFIQQTPAETRTAVPSILNAQRPSQLTTVMTHCHSLWICRTRTHARGQKDVRFGHHDGVVFAYNFSMVSETSMLS